MTQPSHPKVYDSIGTQYRRRRAPDARIAARIVNSLGDARRVCNVGAGTGSYEPNDREVVAVEPSQTMIDQRTSTNPVECATAESLPFADNSFDAAMAVLSVHHWEQPSAGLAEMRRIAARQVVFTFDPDLQSELWLVRDYLPEILEMEQARAISIAGIADCLDRPLVESVPVPWDCVDGFQGAYWRRPEMYLEPEVQACMSTLAQLPTNVVQRAMTQLATDLEDGTWQQRNGHLLQLDELDLGYRLIVSDNNR